MIINETRKKLNEIYKPLFNEALDFQAWFEQQGNKTKLGFYNRHYVLENDDFLEEFFPLPVLDVYSNLHFDFGLDLDHAFIEITYSKAKALKIDYKRLKPFDFSVYGFKDCTDDFYTGNIEEIKENIKNSKEVKIQIGFNLKKDKEIKQNIFKILQVLNIK